MYVELVENGITNRGKIVPISSVGKAPRDYEAYISLFPFDKHIIDYVNTNKTIRGYTGKHACLFLCVDIDNENDIEAARLSTIQVVRRLNTLYNVSPDELFIYYSGNKGFHIYLCDRLLGIQNQYFDSIGDKCKVFIGTVFEGIDNIDTKIYEDHRIIRIPNSRHQKSGRYKVEISFDELQSELKEILELATSPRFMDRNTIYSDIHTNTDLSREFLSVFSGVTMTDYKETPLGFWGVKPKGDRNDGYYKQACALFTHSELSEKSIFDIISAFNDISEDPIDKNELRILVNSANKSREPKEEEKQEQRLYTFQESIPFWIDSIKPEKQKIHLAFPKFDEEMKGKLRGKVCDVIGYGGSKKSLISHYTAYLNTINGQRILYSSMEMGIPDLMERTINMVFDAGENSAAWELERINETQPGKVLDLLHKEAATVFGDRFLITDSSAMTSSKYDLLIKDINDKIGGVDVLVVDGLGMMGGTGTDTERYSEASKELKELAKKWNLFVMLICHISKGEDRESKDLSRAVRSSEKIIDNCDFYISMSQHKLKDYEGNANYNNVWGNARLVNKRGSGRVVDVFFELDWRRLKFNETQKDFITQEAELPDYLNK